MYWLGPDSYLIDQSLFGLPVLFGLLSLVIWSLIWKGLALWLAARRGENWWFIALLCINTIGLLEIFYIFVIAQQSDVKPNLKQHA